MNENENVNVVNVVNVVNANVNLETVKIILCILFLCIFFPGLWSQTVKNSRTPGVLVKMGDGTHTAMVLKELDVKVRIHGAIAETKMTMTFFNPHQRMLEGQLYFPLPEDTFVSGYALDINGKMIDGVVVEKNRARVVFENIVRQGIDPGLLEWSGGNTFKTRIYPLPPRNSRKISVRYISRVDFRQNKRYFRLPIGFKQMVDRFTIKVEVVRGEKKPRVIEGKPRGFVFRKWQRHFVAHAQYRDHKLRDDMLIALPGKNQHSVRLETTANGAAYFCITLTREQTGAMEVKTGNRKVYRAPRHVTIFWDASHSHGSMDHQRELELIKSYFGSMTHTVTVDLVVFRNRREKVNRFRITKGNTNRLMEMLKKIDYDGATNLGAVAPLKGRPVPGIYMVFSDGNGNFGKEEPGSFKAPVFVFVNGKSVSHALLRHLAQSHGGRYFNLKRREDGDILREMKQESPYMFLSADFRGGTLSGIYPGSGRAVEDSFILCGKLLVKSTDITINFGRNGKISKRLAFHLNKDDAVTGQMLKIYRAQEEIAHLMISVRKNRERLVETGKRYGLVTPGTSMLVLDNVNQYIQYEIEPPESLPRMRAHYHSVMNNRQKTRQAQRLSKLDRVITMWRDRVQWWNRSFEPPPRAKKKPKKRSKASLVASIQVPEEEEEAIEGLGGDFGVEGGVKGDIEGVEALSIEGGVLGGVFGADKGDQSTVQARRMPIPESAPPSPQMTLKPWNPDTPYLEALQGTEKGGSYAMYLEQKGEHGNSPAFYLECANFFFKKNQRDIGLQVLSNLAELELENAPLLRMLGHRLRQLDYLRLSAFVFEKVLRMRPEEPQSYRDLALVLESRKHYKRAIKLYYDVVLGEWQRFRGIEVIVLMELNRCLAKARAAGISRFDVDDRLIKLLDIDMRIVLTWNVDATDMDLWVIDPTGQKTYYGNRLSRIGALISNDFTDGYGPEEFVLKKAVPGKYKVMVNYFGSRSQKLLGPVTLQVDIFTHYGRKNEKKRSITLRLKKIKGKIAVGDITF